MTITHSVPVLGENNDTVRSSNRWSRYGLYVMAGLSVCVALASVRFLFMELSDAAPAMVGHGDLRPWSFYFHVAGASVALMVGPWQFFSGIRNRLPAAHRGFGITYVIACLVGGISGLDIGYHSPNGPVAATGFVVLGVMWLSTTGLGLVNILKGNIMSHKRWMVRSFSLTFAAVTLRLYLPPLFANGLDPVIIFGIVAWVSWVPNYFIANYFILKNRKA